MTKSLLVFACLLAVAQAANWALLVAGSNGYYNYRHQADICHSYQVLRARGFTDDFIVTMFYDDIANNSENPVKGNLINQPDGPNVYTNCKKDYTGNTVTPQNFLKVLSGKNMDGIGTGKTLQTTAEDNIFVFFSDHGAVGLLAFPSDELHALDLNNTITSMFANHQYKQMVIYIEACEAGSMFNNILSPSINVLAITASDPNHSSYAIYYDDSRQTYLGDVFSVYWMQDTEAHAEETIQTQFTTVQAETTTSRVCDYGDTSIEAESISLFQSPAQQQLLTPRTRATPLTQADTADSRDVEVNVLQHRLKAASPADRPRIAAMLDEAIARRSLTDARMRVLSIEAATTSGSTVDFMAEFLTSDAQSGVTTDPVCNPPNTVVSDHLCLREMVGMYKKACGRLDDYALKYVRLLNILCSHEVAAADMSLAFAKACQH